MAGSTVRLPNGDEFWLTMDIPKGELPGILVSDQDIAGYAR